MRVSGKIDFELNKRPKVDNSKYKYLDILFINAEIMTPTKCQLCVKHLTLIPKKNLVI